MLLLRRDGAGHQGGLAAHQRLSLIDPAGSLVSPARYLFFSVFNNLSLSRLQGFDRASLAGLQNGTGGESRAEECAWEAVRLSHGGPVSVRLGKRDGTL